MRQSFWSEQSVMIRRMMSTTTNTATIICRIAQKHHHRRRSSFIIRRACYSSTNKISSNNNETSQLLLPSTVVLLRHGQSFWNQIPTFSGWCDVPLTDLGIEQAKDAGRLMKEKKQVFKFLAKANKVILPSFTKKGLDITKASKSQLAIIGWRSFVTQNSLN